MKPNEIETSAEVRALIDKRGLRHVKVGVFDIDGVLNGKYMARDKFLSALEGGFGFCDVVLGWDVDNQLYDNTTLTGWHAGYRDAAVRVIPGSCRELPLEENMLFFLGEFAGDHEALCPRAVLRRTLDKADSLGFEAIAACEYEFLALDEDGPSVRAKGFRSMTPLGAGNFGYSVLRNSVNAEFYRGLLDLCDTMDMPLEGLHEEMGPGALEAAIIVDAALASADKAALFKTFAKIYAQRQKRHLSFMAKWDPAFPGQGGHVHVSLKTKDGAAAFYDSSQPHNISGTMRHFIGGLQKALPELTGTRGANSQFLPAAGARLLGADCGNLGHRQPDRRYPCDPRQQQVAAYRVPRAGRRCQSVSRDGGSVCRRLVGHRKPYRADRPLGRQCLSPGTT